MPQTVRTLLLTCLAWFMPLHALDATTGQWHSVEAAELSSAAQTAWVAGDTVIDLRIDGTLQSIRGTADHPVYVQGGDTFQPLATLRPGDAVRALDGRPSTVVSVTPDPGPRTVQNLTVEFAPTYFIDAEVREGWGGIWVHNDCFDKLRGYLGDMSRAEFERLSSRWSVGGAYGRPLDEHLIDHAERHGFGEDVAEYLREAAAFDTHGLRGEKNRNDDRNGSTRTYRRPGRNGERGTFIMIRNGYIVSFGRN